MPSVGSRIRQLFGRLGVVSQAELAAVLGVQRVTVNRWLKDTREPQKRYVTQMARRAGVSREEMIRYLFYGEELPAPSTVDAETLGYLVMFYAEWQGAASFPSELNGYVRDWCTRFRQNPQRTDREQIAEDLRRILKNNGDPEVHQWRKARKKHGGNSRND